MKKIAFFILVCITIASCEGYRVGEGHIYESETNVVLDSVKYKKINDDYIQHTDSTGHYYIEGTFGGCMSDCIDFDAEFSKAGYKSIIITKPNGDIYLEKE